MPIDPVDPGVLAHRIEALERDSQAHARIITEHVEKVGKGFSEEQLDQLRQLFREELANAGLRIDEPEHQDAAREDFRFLRRLRLAWDAAGQRVGNAVLLAFVGVLATIIGLGFWTWLSQGLSR